VSEQEERDAIGDLVLERREVNKKLAAVQQAASSHASRLERIAKALRDPGQPAALAALSESPPPMETLRALVEELRSLTQQKAELDGRFRLLGSQE